MASLYDLPLETSLQINPFILPENILDSTYESYQKRYDTNRDLLTQYEDAVMVESRPNVPEDGRKLQEIQGELSSVLKTYVTDDLGGDYAKVDPRAVAQLTRGILNKHKDVITQIKYLADLKKVSDEAEMRATAEGQQLIRLGDDINTVPAISPDGTINNVKPIQFQAMLPWDLEINKVFEELGKDEIINEWMSTDPSTKSMVFTDPSQKIDYIKQMFSAIAGVDNEDVQRVIDGRLHSFVQNNSSGRQMMDYYAHEYYKLLKKDNPTADDEELQIQAEEKAISRIKEFMSQVGSTKVWTKRHNKEALQIVKDEKDQAVIEGARSKTRETGDKDVEITEADITLGAPISSTVEGLSPEYATYSGITGRIDQIGSNVRPADITWTDSRGIGASSSLDEVEMRMLYVGPRSQDEAKIRYQFRDDNVSRQGELQRIDPEASTITVTPASSVWESLKSKISDKYGKDDFRYKNMLDAEKNFSQGKADRGQYSMSMFEIGMDQTGAATIRVDPIFMESEELQSKVTEAQSFLVENGDRILPMLYRYDALRDERAALIKVKLDAAKAANIDLEEVESKLSGKNVSEVMMSANVSYLKKLTNFYEGPMEYFEENDPKTWNVFYNLFETASLRPNLNDLGLPVESLQKYITEGRVVESGKNYVTQSGKEAVAQIDSFLEKYLRDRGVEYPMSEKERARYRVTLKNVYNQANLLSPEAKNRMLAEAVEARSEKLAKLDPGIKTYLEQLDAMKNDWTIQSPVVTISSATTDANRYRENAKQFVKAVIEANNNSLYLNEYNRGVLTGTEGTPDQEDASHTLAQAVIRSYYGKPPKEFNENRDKFMKELWDGMSPLLELDQNNGLTFNFSINGVRWEVRDIEGLARALNIGTNNTVKFEMFNSAAKNLKKSGGIWTEIGQDNPTRIYAKQDNREETGGGKIRKKGALYTYIDGKKLYFENLFSAVSWHYDTKEKELSNLIEAGRVVDMDPREFELAYPGVNQLEAKNTLARRYSDHLQQNYVTPSVARTLGFPQDDIILNDRTGSGKPKYYLQDYRIPEDDKDHFKTQDYNVDSDGQRYLKLQKVEQDDILFSKYDEDIMVAGPVKRGLDNLRNIAAQKGFTIVTSESVRSLSNQNAYYDNSGQYSKHLHGLAVDLRTVDPATGKLSHDGQELLNFFASEEGLQWLKDNNLRALHHKIPGSTWHLHLEAAIPVTYRNKTYKGGNSGFTDEYTHQSPVTSID